MRATTGAGQASIAAWADSMASPKPPPSPSPRGWPSSLRSAPEANTSSPAPVSTSTRTSPGSERTAASSSWKRDMDSGLRRSGSLMVRWRTPGRERSVSSCTEAGIEGLCLSATSWALLDEGDRLALPDHVPFLDQELFDGAGDGSQHGYLHLHRLQDHDGVIFLDLLADLGGDLP